MNTEETTLLTKEYKVLTFLTTKTYSYYTAQDYQAVICFADCTAKMAVNGYCSRVFKFSLSDLRNSVMKKCRDLI